jgi:hypothetical protein
MEILDLNDVRIHAPKARFTSAIVGSICSILEIFFHGRRPMAIVALLGRHCKRYCTRPEDFSTKAHVMLRNSTRIGIARIGLLLVTSAIIPLGAGLAEPVATPIELEGTWYVLANYRDAASERPDADLWEDRVWTFEKKGSRLDWTEYPIVIFRDESERFESLASGRKVRVELVWQPRPDQLDEIRSGLRVNARGSKAKSLRGSAERGFRSGGSIRAESASIIGFSESWEISKLDSHPVFRRSDEMGSIRTESLEGATVYETREVLPDGAELVGRFERDDVQVGSFRMLRAGSITIVGNKSRRRDERFD